jgi:hypothetical protein
MGNNDKKLKLNLNETNGTGMTSDSLNLTYRLMNKEDWNIEEVTYNNYGGIEFNACYTPTDEIINFKFKDEADLIGCGGQWILDELNSGDLNNVDDQFNGDIKSTVEIADVQANTDDGLVDAPVNSSNDQITYSQASDRGYIEDGDDRGDGLQESEDDDKKNANKWWSSLSINEQKKYEINYYGHKRDYSYGRPSDSDIVKMWKKETNQKESLNKKLKEENINHMSIHDWNSIIQSIDAQMIHMHPEFGEIEFMFNDCHYLIDLDGDELCLYEVEDVDSFTMSDDTTDVDIAQQLNDMLDVEEEYHDALDEQNNKNSNKQLLETIPEPKAGESESDYVSRFMATDIDKDKPQDQRLAMAYSTYKNKDKKESKKVISNLKEYNLSSYEVHWWQERGGASIWVEDLHNNKEVWSVTDEDVFSLIEDGFIKWDNDKSVLDYLHSVGVIH